MSVRTETNLAMPEPAALEAFFFAAAPVCASETLAHFRKRPDVANKESAGFDPVTIADRAAETALRELIANRFPGHGIIGEEFGAENADARFCWIIDPIDGTRAYISGLPSWGCLVGLTDNKVPVAGMMHQPFTGETFFSAGEASFLVHGGERHRLATSHTQRLADATLMTTAPEMFTPDRLERFRSVSKKARLTRYGFDCYGYAMVAAGHVDLVIESGLQAYDIAPLMPIIEKAGGIVTDWDGGSAANGGSIIAAANPALHAEALACLAGWHDRHNGPQGAAT